VIKNIRGNNTLKPILDLTTIKSTYALCMDAMRDLTSNPN
jgi:hypothetical protein